MPVDSSVNPGPTRTSDAFIDYSALRALVVEDYPGMRNALRLSLTNFGITRVQLAANAAEAIYQVKQKPYDFILCDFNLGEGRDGQQLLEELRHSHLISLGTVFMMVTAESYYEKVVATAELAPDDYMIKPFSPEVLRSRLESVLLRKRAFRDAYRHFHAQKLGAAVADCDTLIQDKPKYLVDALRFKGELLVTLGRFEEAEALYQQVITMRAIPWARLGLARALHLQSKDEAAEAVLRDVMEQAPGMVAAYDLLSVSALPKRMPTLPRTRWNRGSPFPPGRFAGNRSWGKSPTPTAIWKPRPPPFPMSWRRGVIPFSSRPAISAICAGCRWSRATCRGLPTH
ncbi:MAG: response regulator [Gammaproteobacteria bacterium]|nr:response regulator [Gammaproteobacteria bacterium]